MLLMLWLLILLSGKIIEYFQAVSKSCKINLPFWKSLLYKYCEPLAKNPLKNIFLFRVISFCNDFLRLAQSSYFLSSFKELVFIEYRLGYFKIECFFFVWHNFFVLVHVHFLISISKENSSQKCIRYGKNGQK